MISRRTRSFRRAYLRLPSYVQHLADEAYAKFRDDPSHPGLHFKQVHPEKPYYPVRVSSGYRALCVLDGDTAVWYWIGNHDAYLRLIREL